MWNKGLTSTKTTLAAIGTELFNLNLGFLNYGLNTYSGKVAIGLYKDSVFQKTLASGTFNLAPNSCYPNFQFSNMSLKGLTSGNYKICCVYQPTGSTVWSILKGATTLNNGLDVVINGAAATIRKPLTEPSLSLTQAIQPIGKAYVNTTTQFSITVQNTGAEFYSNLGIKIISVADATISKYLNYGVVCLSAGEIKTLTFKGIVNCAPGDYYAVAICDSTNSYSSTCFKTIGTSEFNPISFTVLSQPAAQVLSLTAPIALSDNADIVYKNQNITLNTNIKNTGGYYDSNIIAFVFSTKGGSSLGYLSPKTLYIDTNESKKIELSGSFSLDPGSYYMYLYYYSSGWKTFTPSASAKYTFTLADNPAGIAETAETNMKIYPNPVTDAFRITGIEGTQTLRLLDMNGRLLLTKQVSDNEQISVGTLPQGIYVLKLITANGTTERKMLKQ